MDARKRFVQLAEEVLARIEDAGELGGNSYRANFWWHDLVEVSCEMERVRQQLPKPLGEVECPAFYVFKFYDSDYDFPSLHQGAVAKLQSVVKDADWDSNGHSFSWAIFGDPVTMSFSVSLLYSQYFGNPHPATFFNHITKPQAVKTLRQWIRAVKSAAEEPIPEPGSNTVKEIEGPTESRDEQWLTEWEAGEYDSKASAARNKKVDRSTYSKALDRAELKRERKP